MQASLSPPQKRVSFPSLALPSLEALMKLLLLLAFLCLFQPP